METSDLWSKNNLPANDSEFGRVAYWVFLAKTRLPRDEPNNLPKIRVSGFPFLQNPSPIASTPLPGQFSME